MVYKLFRIIVITRVILLAASVVVLFYLLYESSLYATILIMGLAIVLQIISLIHYVEKTNRDLARFLSSIQYSDFSQTFSTSQKGSAFREMNEAFTAVFAQR
jgi:hypothetical protein